MKIRTYCSLALIYFALSSHAQDIPDMYYTDNASGRPIAKDPSIVYYKNRYRMYYSIPGKEGDGWRIGIATSSDLVEWHKQGELTGVRSYEKNGICAPDAMVRNDTLHLFYQTYGNGRNDAICHAFSLDGLQFERDQTNPVFHPTGSWNNGRAIDAEVIPFEDHYLLYFATRDPAGEIQQMGVAQTPLHSGFQRQEWEMPVDSAILQPTYPWEGKCVEGASVTERKGVLYMFYAGSYNNAPQQIGVARSQDGIVWERLENGPFLMNGPEGSWNYSESGHPDIFKDRQGKYHLFFQGNNNHGASWYLSKHSIRWKDGKPVLSSTNSVKAQTSDLQLVKSEIKEAALNEQNAFKNGDCAQVLDLMETDITFLANGHQAPSKKMIEKFCNSIPRPFKDPTVDKLEIYPLTNDTGYAIRILEYPNDEETKTQEFVTKIWRKTDCKWKIIHLHSTVKKIPISE